MTEPDPRAWQVVPKQLTENMIIAGMKAIIHRGGKLDTVWKAILKAAPKPK